MSKYAKKLTKDDLIKMGVKDIFFNPYDLQYHIINKYNRELSLHQNNKHSLPLGVFQFTNFMQFLSIIIILKCYKN